MKQFILIFCLLLISPTQAADLRGRVGLGATNQLANDIPAISLKIQKSKTFALGTLLGFSTDKDKTLYGAGLKFYRIIYDEPQLNFYMAGTLASLNYFDEVKDQVNSGHQVDGTLGTEFHLTGLESIGFSFEFGLSFRNADSGGATIQTLGDQFLKAGFHFYL